jgi:hypothetical protein
MLIAGRFAASASHGYGNPVRVGRRLPKPRLPRRRSLSVASFGSRHEEPWTGSPVQTVRSALSAA